MIRKEKFKSLISGQIHVRGILGETLSTLSSDIVGKRWKEGEALPKESDLVEELGVSRSVIREACRILGAKGLIKSRTSDGTRVQPRSLWRLLDPDVMEWRLKAGDRDDLLRDLLQLRLIIEPGIAYYATLSNDKKARNNIHRLWQEKCDIYFSSDLESKEKRNAFIQNDINFHLALAKATNSELLIQMFSIIHSALELLFDHQMRARGYTDKMIGMEDTHKAHEKVYNAFSQRDSNSAQAAMRCLVESAIHDANQGFIQLNDNSQRSE
ncbi:MAG: FadR/GntR family transcriptional regulator [Ostreibacterium sp.]